jgi:hypothetical protein
LLWPVSVCTDIEDITYILDGTGEIFYVDPKSEILIPKSETISKSELSKFKRTQRREKSSPSIIRDTCAIDSKNCPVFRDSGHVTRYEERSKKFF